MGSAPPPPARPKVDERLAMARAVAARTPSSRMRPLDDLVVAARQSTPELGLGELLAESPNPPRFPIIRPGDRVNITTVNRGDFSGDARVDVNGRLRLPPLDLQVAGLTPDELEAQVHRFVTDGGYASHATVSVTISEYSGREVHVAGRVVRNSNLDGQPPRSDAIELPVERPFDLFQLLAEVQWFAADADTQHLHLARSGAPQGGSAAAEGATPPARCFHFSLAELSAAHLAGQRVWVRPDDRLIVPRLAEVYVFGSVEEPGAYPLQPGDTVAAALLAAGGTSEGASVRELLLLSGEEEGPAGEDQVLQPGQVVFVPALQPVYIVGLGVTRNGPLVIPPTGLTAVEALKEAGWFTRFACRDSVEIHRKGKVIEVPEEVIEGEESDARYELLPGDTVWVPESRW